MFLFSMRRRGAHCGGTWSENKKGKGKWRKRAVRWWFSQKLDCCSLDEEAVATPGQGPPHLSGLIKDAVI